MLSQPHHDPSVAHVDNPRPDPGDTVTVAVDVPTEAAVDNVLLRHMHDGEARWVEGKAETTATGRRWRFELTCHNRVTNYRFWLGGGSGPGAGARWLNGTGTHRWDPTDHHDFRLLSNGGAPSWVPETVWYQIFPDRFATSGTNTDAIAASGWADPARWDDPVASGPAAMTQCYGGDLDGIAAHLDHLVDLGVGGVYLNPIFPARSNHRYDAVTFDRVDPVLGGDDALVRLRQACDRAGLRLFSDLTPNHTGDGHEWFEAARADADSVEAGFYYFDHHPDDYESWLGIRSLPKLNHASPELRRRFYDGPDSAVGRYLLDPFNLDGWRIDVANMTGRYGLIDLNELVRRTIRSTVDEVSQRTGQGRWLVAEHFFDATADATGDGWHGVMNYAGLARPIVSWLGEFTTLAAMMPGPGQDERDGESVARSMDAFRASMPWQINLGSMALVGSHDTARWRTMARSDELALVGFGLLLASPGAPCFLYGDEIGLEGATSETARAPMPWDRARWNRRFLDRYRQLITARANSAALAHGGFRWVHRSADALCFLRETDRERVLVLARRADGPAGGAPIDVPVGLLDAAALEGLAGSTDIVRSGDSMTLPGDGPRFDLWRLAGR